MLADELPLAQHVLPRNQGHRGEEINRARKATSIAYALFCRHGDRLTREAINALTGTEMASVARQIGVRPPNSTKTEDAVRGLLRTMVETTGTGVSASDLCGHQAPGTHPALSEGQRLAEQLDCPVLVVPVRS
ncbi:hypothetical protein [Streptomyces nanshensis]|uniref:hypothetical protein n=1 Tax=Streptomyces nanshensis TaxID=518642 RepID=UPI00085C4B96|nr:hypothetical protein [Streptomyces nanshensis]